MTVGWILGSIRPDGPATGYLSQVQRNATHHPTVARPANLSTLASMLSRLPVVLLALVVALFARAAPATAPADPDLNSKGRAILAYFQQLQTSPDLKLVSGQFCGWSGGSDIETLAKIERATGKWPAVIGLDYCAWDEGQAVIDVNPPNRLAKLFWHQGGLVTISWHAPNPANPKGGGLNDKGV